MSTVGEDPEVLADRLWSLGARAVEERAGALVAGFSDHAAAVRAGGVTGGTILVIDDDAWQTAWREWARVVRVGRIVVHPAWVDLGPAEPGDVVVHLEPQSAFGDGNHPSTRLALEAVGRFAAAGSTVLDVGCGSGVLSVAAALLGATVTAVDVDEGAVRVTRGNADRNGVTVTASSTPLAEVQGRFDLVVANIGGTRVLVEMAPDLRRLAGRGVVVLAGMLVGAEEPAVEALAPAQVVDRRTDDGWVAVACVVPDD